MSEPPTVGGVRNFSRPRNRILFQIDTDLFEASPAVPAEVLVDFANGFTGMGTDALSPDEQYRSLMSVLKLVLLPESFALLSSRAKDRARPVELDQLSDVILWLLEQYGLRPTEQPSPSSAGQLPPASGTNLTGSTPVEVSISSPSLSTAS